MNKLIMTRSQMCALGARMPELLVQLGKYTMTTERKGMDDVHVEFTFHDPSLSLMTNRFLAQYCRLELEEE